MNALLGILTAIVFVAVLLVVPAHSDAAGALTVCVLLAFPVGVLLWRNKVEGQFLLQVFVAALLVAFFPSLVLWSSQGLKDGPIVFILVLAILLTLQLGEKFSFKNTVMLCLVLATLISFRFYLFYMMTAAVLGAFIIGTREFTLASFISQVLVVIGIGVVLT